MKIHRLIAPLAALLILLVSCTHEPEPRKTVKLFLQSLRTDTTSYDYLSQLLDLDELVTENSVYTFDSTISIEENKLALASLFQKGGTVRARWIKNQIVLGNVDVLRDTATVEVSFINKDVKPVKQYYNKMGVHLIDGQWKIFAFRLF